MGSKMGSKRSSKKIVSSKSSNDMSKDLVQSILREETGDTSVRRRTPGKKSSKKAKAVEGQAKLECVATPKDYPALKQYIKVLRNKCDPPPVMIDLD